MVCGAVCDNNISILCIASLLAAASYITHRICDWGAVLISHKINPSCIL